MKSTHFWLPSARSGLENSSFTPGKTLSVREIKLFCSATTFFMYKLYWREHSFSCSLIASMGVYSRRSTQLSSPYLAIFFASALSVLTLRMEPPPLRLINNGFITVTQIPYSCRTAATGSWYRPVASMITRVSSPRPGMASAICSKPTSVWGYSLGLSTTLFIGCRATIMLFPLDTSIPTAFIVPSCMIDMASASISRRLFNLLADANAPGKADGTTCVNRMLRMRETADGLQCGRVSPR